MICSAVTGPRASRVRPPRDCAARCALVLKCVWMKLHRHSFLCNIWNLFPLLLFFKGVGPRGVTMQMGCFIFEFRGS